MRTSTAFETSGLSIEPLHAFALATLGGGIAYSLQSFLRHRTSKKYTSDAAPQSVLPHRAPEKAKSQRPDISALPVFAAPFKFRPYRSSSEIHSCNPNDLILIDTEHRRRLSNRRYLLSSDPSSTYGHVMTATPAINEFYNYLLTHQLPRRFPKLFGLSPSGTYAQNYQTDTTYPIFAAAPTNALRTIGENVDEDFIILQPDAQHPGSWMVGGWVVCSPNGFRMTEKTGRKLGEPHGSELEAKLGKSLESYLSSLECGADHAVEAHGWNIVNNGDLFCLNDNKVFGNQDGNLKDVCLRVERQTLWKLPNSGGVVFGIKTYITPLSTIKAEGDGPTLAQAIESRFETQQHGALAEQVLEFLRA